MTTLNNIKNIIQNADEALDFFRRKTTFSWLNYGDELSQIQDIGDFIIDNLSGHEPYGEDFSEFDEETESGIIYEFHKIEISPFRTKSRHPEHIEVEVKITEKDGCAWYDIYDIRFIC